MEKSPPLIALVLCGGGGQRLWPLSNEARPKQFLRLTGEDTLFQSTLLRLGAAADESVILTNVALESHARADYAELQAQGRIAEGQVRFVLEPARRDSGPAIAAGVAAIKARHGDDAIILVVASDHLIPDHAAFARTIAQGRALAGRDYLVTFGITPRHAATEYGYIQRGRAVFGLDGAYEVEKFHEKPDAARAALYAANPDFAWNSGNFMFRAGFFAKEAEAHMPDIWAAATRAVSHGAAAGDRLLLEAEAFGAARRISIDFALIEHSRRVGTIPARFDWSDIGSWSAVHAASPQNAAGFATRGDVQARDCKDSLVFAEDMPVFAIGLEDYVVIATKSGVFIAPRGRAQEIKAMLDQKAAS